MSRWAIGTSEVPVVIDHRSLGWENPVELDGERARVEKVRRTDVFVVIRGPVLPNVPLDIATTEPAAVRPRHPSSCRSTAAVPLASPSMPTRRTSIDSLA